MYLLNKSNSVVFNKNVINIAITLNSFFKVPPGVGAGGACPDPAFLPVEEGLTVFFNFVLAATDNSACLFVR